MIRNRRGALGRCNVGKYTCSVQTMLTAERRSAEESGPPDGPPTLPGETRFSRPCWWLLKTTRVSPNNTDLGWDFMAVPGAVAVTLMTVMLHWSADLDPQQRKHNQPLRVGIFFTTQCHVYWPTYQDRLC
jgi:hypothetical protein